MRKFTVKPKTITASTNIDTQSLERYIWAALEKDMKKKMKGDDSWKEYTVVEVGPWDENPEMIEAEVRSEFLVNYKSQVEIDELLDEVVVKYDPDAYFEPWSAGISQAYLRQ